MDDNTRRRFESIFQLYGVAWQQFNTRRVYEWQVTISIWTAIALTLAGVCNTGEVPKFDGGIWTLMGFGGMILALQILWCKGITNGHRIDQSIAFHYEKILQDLSNTSFTPELVKKTKASQDNFGKVFQWNHLLQVGISALLLAILIVVVWGKTNTTSVSRTKLEMQKLEAEISKLQLEMKSIEHSHPTMGR